MTGGAPLLALFEKGPSHSLELRGFALRGPATGVPAAVVTLQLSVHHPGIGGQDKMGAVTGYTSDGG